jgi:hypothetical protein
MRANYNATINANDIGTRPTMTLNTEELPSRSETQRKSVGYANNQPEQVTLGQQTT